MAQPNNSSHSTTVAFIIGVILIQLLVACGGGGGNSGNEPPPPPPPLSACGAAVEGATCKTIEVESIGERHFYLYQPANQQGTLPLLILLHGAPGTPRTINSFIDGVNFAEENGYLLAIPVGEGDFAWSSQVTANSAISKDSLFVSAIINDLVTNHQGDSDNVYITGFSAGGFMIYQLACEIPEQITAAMAISGQFRGEQQACDAAAPTKIHHVHGTNDPDVPLNGRQDGIASVSDTLAIWEAVNNCDSTTTISAEFVITSDGKTATTRRYDNCASALEYTQVALGEHDENYDLVVLHQMMIDFFRND
ncbi:hypothetical protein FLL45_17725 [Aliikangiella marina]|uniref:Phospholipase/carboxylesterase/thioesterase domain-containing protein n=1 Tax=Aliikangiella marina TaxID=1712262 RepID=A0A545T4B0_9GAMM|nr:PHB depolymerase family esterase [Aliikangiella marina]TQV72008.1 hypothetical protein FLL45_17445 [Aliikangiella marina]TQV72061.1 hypothetical protein FLL45_17725 [Aliikangiella marina]